MTHAIQYGRHLTDRDLADQKSIEDQIFQEGYNLAKREAEQDRLEADAHDLDVELADRHAADMAQRAADIAESISGLWLAVKEMQKLTRSLDHRNYEYISACTTIVRCLTAIDVLEGLGK